jgi:hypothetical protein
MAALERSWNHSLDLYLAEKALFPLNLNENCTMIILFATQKKPQQKLVFCLRFISVANDMY